MNVPRWLSPKTNPALYTAALGVLFAIWQALQVQAAAGPLTWSQVGRVAGGVILAAVAYGPHRRATTPVADPRDGNGNPLKLDQPVTVAISAPGVEPAQVIAAIRHAVHTTPALKLREPVRGGYTGGKPASEMPPPPMDIPSVSKPPGGTAAGTKP